MVQLFKGDAEELKYKAAADQVFNATEVALDDFYENGAQCEPFLLMLYDEGRVPFSQRINRDVFVSFVKRALENYPFIGNFESYLFILREIFGAESEILFDVPAPGKLAISVNSIADVIYQFIGRTVISGGYETFDVVTSDGDELVFRGLSGIDSERELGLLLSEIIPNGVFTTFSLEFFTTYSFVGEDDDGEFDMVTHLGDQLIFVEIGG